MRRIHKGFTLVELMIVLSIIGVLSAIAMPFFKDYAIRARVADLIISATPYKTMIAEFAWSNHTLASAGQGLTVSTSGKVTGGSISTDGVIQIVGNAASIGVEVTIVLTPTILSNNRVLWTCGTGGNTTVHKFVPSDCRN